MYTVVSLVTNLYSDSYSFWIELFSWHKYFSWNFKGSTFLKGNILQHNMYVCLARSNKLTTMHQFLQHNYCKLFLLSSVDNISAKNIKPVFYTGQLQLYSRICDNYKKKTFMLIHHCIYLKRVQIQLYIKLFIGAHNNQNDVCNNTTCL